MSDELRDYEIRVKRLGRFRWRRMVLFNGSGASGPEHETRTRWGALRKAHKEIRDRATWHQSWERAESGLYGPLEEE